jgi:hypothetical protein
VGGDGGHGKNQLPEVWHGFFNMSFFDEVFFDMIHILFCCLMFPIIGAFGLMMISVGILLKNRTHQNILYILGGICLEVYSIYLQNVIFIILQFMFILAPIVDLVKRRPKKKKR